MAVFVLDKKKKPLMPCTEKRARQLLERRRAVVHTTYPFTIRLKDRVGGATQPTEIRLDPGSKSTGVAVVRRAPAADHVLHLAEVQHRGRAITEALTSRASLRKTRRGRKLRRRPARFNNRTRSAGWLPPSLRHRVETAAAYARKLVARLPAPTIAMESVKFDTQLMRDPEIRGVAYQQGALAGYEVREYLLEKWGRTCVYCGCVNVPLQIDHVVPRSRGGSDRVDNLTLACQPCNQAKGNMPVEAFLARQPAVLRRILAGLNAPLRDAAAMNSTRPALLRALGALCETVGQFTGAHTKWVRTRLGLPKTHALDAACVGDMDALTGWDAPVLVVRCTGRGSRQRAILNKFGFARAHKPRFKNVNGFSTGDMVCAVVKKGKRQGVWTGRVSIRTSGFFNIKTAHTLVQGVSYKNCKIIQRGDGHDYTIQRNNIKSTLNSSAYHDNVILI